MNPIVRDAELLCITDRFSFENDSCTTCGTQGDSYTPDPRDCAELGAWSYPRSSHTANDALLSRSRATVHR